MPSDFIFFGGNLWSLGRHSGGAIAPEAAEIMSAVTKAMLFLSCAFAVYGWCVCVCDRQCLSLCLCVCAFLCLCVCVCRV